MDWLVLECLTHLVSALKLYRYHQAAETYRPLRYWPIALYARTLPLPRTSLPLVTYYLKLRRAPASDPTGNPSTCFVAVVELRTHRQHNFQDIRDDPSVQQQQRPDVRSGTQDDQQC